MYGVAMSAEATVSITVTPANDAPNAQPDSATTTKNAAVNIAVLANDVDAVLANDVDIDGDQLTVLSVTSPANGTVSITGNVSGINYKPRSGFSGIDSFTYTVTDGRGGTSTATVTVDVKRK
jgi:large repetitive protein